MKISPLLAQLSRK